jgi:NitT/TauT family transport system substrate-binding protein
MINFNTMTRRLLGTGLAATMALALGAVASQAGDMVTLKINRSPVGTFQGLFIAEQLGYFKDRGIAVEMHVGSSPDAAIAELMAGTSDISMTGAVPLVASVANGLNVTAVLNTQDQGEPPTMGLLVPGASDIKTITDLKGKKIGLPGIASPQGAALLIELAKHDMTRDDVELVNLPFPGVLSAIESGAVDAGIPVGLFYTLGIQGGMREFREVFDNLHGAPAVLFAANKDWADENAEVLSKFIEAMLLAYEYGNANPDIIREIDAANTRMPPEFIKTRDIAPFVGPFTVDEWNKQNADLVTFGFLPEAPASSEFIWSGTPTN